MNDKFLDSVIEDENRAASVGGRWSVVLFGIPPIIFMLISSLVMSIRVTHLLEFPPTTGEKISFYGISLFVFEVFYTLISGGYGLLGIPAGIVMIIILCW